MGSYSFVFLIDVERKMASKRTPSGTTARIIREANAAKAEKIQSALYQISDAASAMMDMQGFYAVLHRIMRELMYAENFYVTLYDPETRIMTAAYFADEAGDIPPAPSKLEEFSKSLRAYVLRTGKTLHVSGAEIVEGKRLGLFEPMGTPAEDWIGVPLKIGGRSIGSLTIQSYEKGIRYDEQDVQLLEFVAQHIAVALNRARAIDETRQRNTELHIINSVQEGLVSRLDMQAIYELVGEKIRETFNAQIVNIATYDRATHLMRGRYFFEAGQVLPGITLPVFGFRKHVLENQEPLVINQDMSHWMEVYANPVLEGVQPKSAIFVPMIVGDGAIGVISLQNIDQENAFSEADLRLLTTLANSMSVALENARLFDETQRLLKETEQRNAELAIINSVQEGLASKLDMQAIYDLVGNKMSEIFNNKDVSIRILDPKTNLLHYPYTFENGQRLFIEPFPFAKQGFGPYVLLTRESLMINENMPQAIEQYGSGIIPGTQMSKSLVMVPLISGDQARGLIILADVNREHAFNESDLRLLETLANSMSVALENARLWEEEKKYRRALERELEIGREIQAGFLPEALPYVAGWEIAASLMSAREVAGDFYDAFELPDGKIGLVIADVCDKGVGAALFMTLFRSLIRVIANLEHFEHGEGVIPSYSTTERLKRAVAITNNYIAETHGDSGMFATLFFGILDPQTGKLTYVNGGHEPPLIFRAGSVRETLRKTGPAVGVVMDCRFDLMETNLLPGETFFAFTDGVPDCKNPGGEFFGRVRLLDIFRNNVPTPELIHTVETELRQFISGETQFDDITLLALKRL